MKQMLFGTKSQLKPPVWQFHDMSEMQQPIFCAFGLLAVNTQLHLQRLN